MNDTESNQDESQTGGKVPYESTLAMGSGHFELLEKLWQVQLSRAVLLQTFCQYAIPISHLGLKVLLPMKKK